jgi:SRSO17 transposase
VASCPTEPTLLILLVLQGNISSPEGEKEPTKYWLSTLPEGITFRRLVDFAKLRWRIERAAGALLSIAT